MTYGGPSGQDEPRSLIRASSFWRRRETSARAELVWNDDVPTLRTLDIDPVREASPAGAPGAAHDASANAEATPATAAAALSAEIAARRQAALDQLDAELRTRRDELARSLERQRHESEQRIAETERLEAAAIARRREALEAAGQADEGRLIGERIDAAFAEQLAKLKERYAGADTHIREYVASRQREEMSRLEEWRAAERERIEAELTAEEQRFHERLLRQLQEFEHQLGERAREQEERLARAWGDAEERAKQQLAALFSPPER